MGKTVRKIETTKIPEPYKKVGIYCRVSSSSQAQLHSLAAQVSEMTRYVMWHSGWKLVDIYMDVGSGSNVEHRAEYRRMLNDAKGGSLDLIVTKSVSRFGRNVEEILTTTQSLTEAGAIVYFQLQETNTSDPNCELMLSIYGSTAQAELQNLSENIRWSINKRAKDGTSAIFDRTCYGYCMGEDGEFAIVEEEAIVIRKIYNMYLSGYSIVKIKTALEAEGVLSPSKREKWSKNTIERILTNKKYYGCSEIWKSYSTGESQFRRVTNKGEHDRIEVQDHHEAIIPQKIFDMVQEERIRRSNVEIGEDGTPHRRSEKYSSLRKK